MTTTRFTQYNAYKLNERVYIQWLNERAILLSLSDDCQKELSKHQQNKFVQAYFDALMSAKPSWLIDLVPSYNTLLIEFDALEVDHYFVVDEVRHIDVNQADTHAHQVVHRIPVCFDLQHENYPNDLASVQQHLNITNARFKTTYLKSEYRVFTVGFMPNFAYLGHLPTKLNMPRLSTPRTNVPAGAVAIADDQTAIYPADSPGGWHILGYTPINLLTNQQYQFSMGQSVCFYEINAAEFMRLKALEEQEC